MTSEQEASKQLMVRNWTFAFFEKLDEINICLKELGISPDQLLQFIEANNEIKDADFRAAAFDLLELKKRTGETSKEAAVYIKGLDYQIAAREKQISDLTAKIEKTKSEARGWEQKRDDERAKILQNTKSKRDLEVVERKNRQNPPNK